MALLRNKQCPSYENASVSTHTSPVTKISKPIQSIERHVFPKVLCPPNDETINVSTNLKSDWSRWSATLLAFLTYRYLGSAGLSLWADHSSSFDTKLSPHTTAVRQRNSDFVYKAHQDALEKSLNGKSSGLPFVTSKCAAT